MTMYQGLRTVTLSVVRTAAKAIALVLSVAFAVAVTAGAAPGAPTLAPVARPITAAEWTPAQALAAYEAAQITINTGALVKFGQDWQMSAYRTRAEMARSSRAASAALAVWADKIAAGRWAPTLRPLAQAAALEGRQMSSFYARLSSLPTKASMDRAMQRAAGLSFSSAAALHAALQRNAA